MTKTVRWVVAFQPLRISAPWVSRWISGCAYNGGSVVTGAKRTACAGSRGCNPARYFDNVERFCGATGRSAASCRENRQYPRVILEFWAPAYHRWLQG